PDPRPPPPFPTRRSSDLGGRGDEATGEVGVDGARADEEAAAEREAERRLDARLEGPDPFPRALDTALDGRVEATAARDLEIRETDRKSTRLNSSHLVISY